jgi:hypothetical protein
MRALCASPLVVALMLSCLTACLAGCESNLPPPQMPDPVEPEAPIVVESPPDATPKVVRRLVAEAREQVEKDRQMASELRDSRGRARAQGEADTLERELAILAARIDNPDSQNLDEVMSQLQLLDTRIDLLHDKLRAATERTTAVEKD